jgi:predicted transcriptional regulator
VTPEATAAVEAIVKENRCVTVNEIATHLDMSHGSAHRIICDFSAVLKIFNI